MLSELCSRSLYWKIKSFYLAVVPNSLAMSSYLEIWPRKQQESNREKCFWENHVLWSPGKTVYWFPSSNGQKVWLFSRSNTSELWFRKRVCTVGITDLEHHCRKTDIHDLLWNLTRLQLDEKKIILISFPLATSLIYTSWEQTWVASCLMDVWVCVFRCQKQRFHLIKNF